MFRADCARKQTGFTLVEALVTVTILAIGFAGVFKLHTYLLQSSAEAKSRTDALAVAEQKLEELREFIDDDPHTAGTGTTTIAAADAAGRNSSYTLDWTIDDQNIGLAGEPVSPYYKVTINVSWTYKGQPHRLVLESHINNTDPALAGQFLAETAVSP